MSVAFFTADPKQILVPSGFAERDEEFIHDHLKAYCSLFDPLPAITVTVSRDRFQLVKGKQYLDIAKELGRRSIRAAAFGSGVENVAGYIAKVPESELEKEQEQTVVDGWHMFFLERSASEGELQTIRNQFEAFLACSLPGLIDGFEPNPTEWNADGHSGLFSVRFPTPLVSQLWADKYRQMFLHLPEGLRFISYQGRKIEFTDSPQAPRG